MIPHFCCRRATLPFPWCNTTPVWDFTRQAGFHRQIPDMWQNGVWWRPVTRMHRFIYYGRWKGSRVRGRICYDWRTPNISIVRSVALVPGTTPPVYFCLHETLMRAFTWLQDHLSLQRTTRSSTTYVFKVTWWEKTVIVKGPEVLLNSRLVSGYRSKNTLQLLQKISYIYVFKLRIYNEKKCQ